MLEIGDLMEKKTRAKEFFENGTMLGKATGYFYVREASVFPILSSTFSQVSTYFIEALNMYNLMALENSTCFLESFPLLFSLITPTSLRKLKIDRRNSKSFPPINDLGF